MILYGIDFTSTPTGSKPITVASLAALGPHRFVLGTLDSYSDSPEAQLYKLEARSGIGANVSFLPGGEVQLRTGRRFTNTDPDSLIVAPGQAKRNLRRIAVDTYIGMGFSNLVAFFIMLTTAVTLHVHGVTDIQTSAQAAEALRPIAGDFAFMLFAAGIVGTGLLAVPVLAGSAAYAVAEAFEWRIGLGLPLLEARGFYAILSAATLLGVAMNFSSIDPIKALIWSAVINGVISVPIMAVMMLMAVRPEIMGQFVVKRRLKWLGWLATAVMAAAVVTMFATMGR